MNGNRCFTLQPEATCLWRENKEKKKQQNKRRHDEERTYIFKEVISNVIKVKPLRSNDARCRSHSAINEKLRSSYMKHLL